MFVVFACVRLVYLWYQSNKLASVGWVHLGAKSLLTSVILAASAAALNYSIEAKNEGLTYVWLVAPIMQIISVVCSYECLFPMSTSKPKSIDPPGYSRCRRALPLFYSKHASDLLHSLQGSLHSSDSTKLHEKWCILHCSFTRRVDCVAYGILFGPPLRRNGREKETSSQEGVSLLISLPPSLTQPIF